jgi:hypothetical protein
MTRSAFDWNTGEPTVFALDPYFTPKGKDGLTHSAIASQSREKAESEGKNVATIGGIGQVVIDTVNTREFHVHRKAGK